MKDFRGDIIYLITTAFLFTFTCCTTHVKLPASIMFASASFRHVLREAAPNLTRRYFSCQAHSIKSSSRHRIPPNASRLFTRDFKNAQTHLRNAHVPHQRGFRTSTRLREAVAQAETAAVKKSSFPDTSSNAVAYWLLASAASVFGIVVFGGLTRLTESG